MQIYLFMKLILYNLKEYFFRLMAIVLIAFNPLSNLFGQIQLSESFNYPPETTLTTANWTIVGTVATNPIKVTQGNLNYQNTIANGFGNKVALVPNGQDVQRTFTTIKDEVYSSLHVNVSAATPKGDFFYSLGYTGNPMGAYGPKIFIRSNAEGFSFGVLRGAISGTPVYETVVRPFNTTFRLVLKYQVVDGVNNDIVKLYVNPEFGEPTTADVEYSATAGADVASLNIVALVQGTLADAPTLEVDAIHVGSTWNSVSSARYDYGDAPKSYEFSKDNVYSPAVHYPLEGLLLGNVLPDVELTPQSVIPGADNNGENGDGLDEDALSISNEHSIRKGVPYSITVPVKNPTVTSKYLYGWIDFNNDGKFQANEVADVIVNVTTVGKTVQTLTWSGDKTGLIADDATKLYMRLRLSDRLLVDFTTAANGGALIDERSIGNGAMTTANANDHALIGKGEVEDYQIEVINTFDYGDAPASFENDKDGNPLPARNAYLEGFTIGQLIDIETKPASVISPNENNTVGDNAVGVADEDGITDFISVTPGVPYTITVPINIPETLTGTKYLYAWLDLNGDGKFQLDEYTFATTSLTGDNYLNLSWSALQTKIITNDTEKIYLRLRLSNIPLYDFTSAANGGSLIDERSIGNGVKSTTDATHSLVVPYGEVEDYQLSVNLYDFGDAPLVYENNGAGDSYPARQIANPSYHIGKTVEAEKVANSVALGTDNNGTNGDGLEEDGLINLPVIIKGTPFSFLTTVTTEKKANMIAWIDFNNNGIFEETEVAYTQAVGNLKGYKSTELGTSEVTFYFRGEQSSLIPDDVKHVYARIRLTETPGVNNNATDVDERSIGDGGTTGVYTLPSIGEVEDYRFEIGKKLVDFGDAPISYEMDKDGTDPINFVPARNLPTSSIYLGETFTLEEEPSSVNPGDNNNEANGDGISDDGISSNQLFIKANGINSYNVSLHNSTGEAATLYAWIDFNNNGRFEASEVIITPVASGINTVKLSFTSAQSALMAINVNKLYMRLRLIKPDQGVKIEDYVLASGINPLVVDERAIGDGLITGQYGIISYGEVEDYQLTVLRDFGDVPVSYENADPASHTNGLIPELRIGNTIDYELMNNPVASGADNNGENGDGLDEDGIVTPQTITIGSPFTLKIPINSIATSANKYLYAWIDLNGDGLFNGNEVVLGSVTGTTLSHVFTFTWPATTTATISSSVLAAGKTYVRLRASAGNLINQNDADKTLVDTRSYGSSNFSGEVEDYQFLVSNFYDYGDAPEEYSINNAGSSVPPRQVFSPLLRLGETIDIEENPHTVAPGADNNGENGDGLDEDGVTALMPLYKGSIYRTQISVFNNTGATKILYGWIDLNNNGVFEATEMISANVVSSDSQQTVNLAWTAVNTNKIPEGIDKLYMRLRISDGTLTDLTGTLFDERSIGDGLNTGLYGVPGIGEIEDYQLTVSSAYDYGDAPDSYDMNTNDVLITARQALSDALFIGDTPPDTENAKQIELGTALGDDHSGINDEGGLLIPHMYTGGGREYSLNVKVTNKTGAAKVLYGWIDFNNNGRFEALEYVQTPVPTNSDKAIVTLKWLAARTVITGNPSQLYMRLRLSDAALSDLTGAAGLLVDERSIGDGLSTGQYANVFNVGEIEDHTIPVGSDLDYGDAPVSYDHNTLGDFVPARHIPDASLLIGDTIDTEPQAQNVADGADNNGINGDGLDEDGIVIPLPKLMPGNEYSTLVKVTNNLTTSAILHAWIDMNGDGHFSSDEYTSVTLSPNSGSQTAKLYWYTTHYSGTAESTYMRVRLTSAPLTDNALTKDIDERSIGDGLASGLYGPYPINGEVEDYTLPIDTTVAVAPGCDPTDERLGLMDPTQALFHASIIKTANGDWLVFGNSAHGDGASHQGTPAKVESGYNGFNFAGTPLMVTGASSTQTYHQYFLLSSSGLYVWGKSAVITNPSPAMTQVGLPTGVSPSSIQLIDAGRNATIGSLAILTKTGEVWVYSSVQGSTVQGNGNRNAEGWHQVMLNSETPLTGMKDVRTSGGAIMATDGHNFYTWGNNVSLGNGQMATNRSYATKMSLPQGVSLPVKQLDINNIDYTSYYVRDAQGNVFVLGDNASGQLGLGNRMSMTSWTQITHIYEQPEAAGVQTNIRKKIGKVNWISANNHDAVAPLFFVITDQQRAYSTGEDSGNKSGVPGDRIDRSVLTAVTEGGGAKILKGKMVNVESGGHISILIKQGSDRYGYVGHTIEGSDGCNGCTNWPKEFDFKNPPSTGPVCGNDAFDYGDLDDRYNLGDKASHQIRYAQTGNPLKLGANAADSDDEPQFSISGSANNADGDDLDGKGGLIDEDAFVSGQLPAKIAGNSYRLEIPLTNNTGQTAYVYAFIDWNANGRFEASETKVIAVPPSDTQQIIPVTWNDVGTIAGCDNEPIRSFVRLRLTTSVLNDDESTLMDERSFLAAQDGEVEDYYIDWTCPFAYCYKPGITNGTTLNSITGITSIDRSSIDNQDNWPMVRKGAWLVLESANKGFVLNRVPFNADDKPIGIPVTDFVEGMTVYDTTNNCMKIYTTTDEGATFEWKCFENQACPD